MLLRGLPASARVWQESNGGWSVTDHLLADAVEALYSVRAAVIATVTTKPKQRLNLGQPFRYPRPGAEKNRKSFSWGGLARSLSKGGE